jgi:hypothetical protein
MERKMATVFQASAIAAVVVALATCVAWGAGYVDADTASLVSFTATICGAGFTVAYSIASDWPLRRHHPT